MVHNITTHPYSKFKLIGDKLKNRINTEALPLISESKLYKHTAEWYGHVIIKLDVETDEKVKKYPYSTYSYSWEVSENDLPKYLEPHIKGAIEHLIFLLDVMNDNTIPLRFTVIGGSVKQGERDAHKSVAVDALIKLFNDL